jgi:flagellar motor switch protein FliN/FliY
MGFTRQEWVDRFVADLASVIGAMAGGTATAGPGTDPPQDGWIVTLRGEQGSRGDLFVEFDGAAAAALAKSVMAMDEDPGDDVVVDTLKELCGQAAGSMVLEAPLVGTKLVILAIERGVASAPDAVLAQVDVTDVARLPLRLWGDIAVTEAPRVEAPAASPRAPSPAAAVTPKLDVILDIDLPLTVRFGRTEMPLRLVAALGPGSVIDLGRSPDDPVDVLVSNQLVARGEVVIVGGNYGVRITDVFTPENGARSMEDSL